MEAYRLTGQAKVEGVKDFIENLVKNEVKFLLFAHHIKVLDQLELHKYCCRRMFLGNVHLITHI